MSFRRCTFRGVDSGPGIGMEQSGTPCGGSVDWLLWCQASASPPRRMLQANLRQAQESWFRTLARTPNRSAAANSTGRGSGTRTSTAANDKIVGVSYYGWLPLVRFNASKMVTFDANSPPLAWTAPPPGTVSVVLTMTDIETSSGGNPQDQLLWAVVNLPPSSRLLAENTTRGRKQCCRQERSSAAF